MNSMEAFNSICGDFLQNLRKYADGKTPVRMMDEFTRVILDIIGKVIVGIMIIYAFGGLFYRLPFIVNGFTKTYGVDKKSIFLLKITC